jgi:DNA-binding CsgD family transcriptional regulator
MRAGQPREQSATARPGSKPAASPRRRRPGPLGGWVAEHGPLRVVTFSIRSDEFVVISLPEEAGCVPEFANQRRGVVGQERLTGAERDIVRLALSGLSNRAMAEKRATSPSTVANQLAAIYKKLGLSSRSQLVHWYSIRDAGSADRSPS